MGPGFTEMPRGHHRAKRGFDWPFRIGQETRNTGERLVLLRIEDVKDGSDQ